jgi:hypothetical protein
MVNDKIKKMMDFITSDVIMAIIEDTGLDMPEAMKTFYNSEIFERLCDYQTGLYRESGGYIYDLNKIEKKHGYIEKIKIKNLY